MRRKVHSRSSGDIASMTTDVINADADIRDPVGKEEAEPSDAEKELLIQDVIEHIGFGRFQIKMMVLCGLCWV